MELTPNPTTNPTVNHKQTQQKQSLIEKYFPSEWEDLILPDNIKTSLENIRDSKYFRLLLYSSPGTGKTTTARLMTLGHRVLYLSGSNDFNINTLREKVYPFASSDNTIDGRRKTIIIDEADGIKDNIQIAFKITLDTSKNCNFIFCTNEVDKINDAIRSRCTNFDYDFINDNLEEHRRKYAKHILDICKEQNIKYDSQGLKRLIKYNFPDFRHSLVVMQQIMDAGLVITEENVINCSESSRQNIQLYELIDSPQINGSDLYEKVCQYKGSEKETLISLGEPYFKYLNDKGEYERTLKVAEVMSQYYDSYFQSINKFVTLFSCISTLRKIR